MPFQNYTKDEELGRRVGFFLAYFIFSTILYYVLTFLGKLPDTWKYYHVMIVVLSIVLFGILVRWLLK